MKVGDLVIMPGNASLGSEAPGIVIKMPFVGPNGERQQTPRVGIFWTDGDGGIDWEPMAWLKVISEAPDRPEH
ncbi:MAG: hypothetical protein NZ789_06630 [Pseudomonadales bacterium]|nr:hypothetical protein [Pseudomonadales bacterium]